jgi:hypothetical protein
VGRQQAITRAKLGPKPAQNSGLAVEPETEQELRDKRVPEGSMMDDALLYSVQAALWEMMGMSSVFLFAQTEPVQTY